MGNSIIDLPIFNLQSRYIIRAEDIKCLAFVAFNENIIIFWSDSSNFVDGYVISWLCFSVLCTREKYSFRWCLSYCHENVTLIKIWISCYISPWCQTEKLKVPFHGDCLLSNNRSHNLLMQSSTEYFHLSFANPSNYIPKLRLLTWQNAGFETVNFPNLWLD